MLPRFGDLRSFAATLRCTRSVRTAWRLHARRVRPAAVRLPGFAGDFHLRTGTSDAQFLRSLAWDVGFPEYRALAAGRPRVILDIGANIGVVAAWLAAQHPQARLYAFEPLPENAALMQRNLAQFPNVRALAFGLGRRSTLVPFTRSEDPRNFGGGGFHGDHPVDAARPPELLPVVAVPEALAALGITHIDAIKIDTEGAEHDILTSIPEAILGGVSVIVGELHGKPDDDALLEWLAARFTVTTTRSHGAASAFEAHACGRSAPPTGKSAAASRDANRAAARELVGGGRV